MQRLPSRAVVLRRSGSSFGDTIANHPVGSLTLAGGTLGALLGAASGAWFGVAGMKIGAAAGAAVFGLKGYSTGKDLKAWLK
jgi:hypothetical protein